MYFGELIIDERNKKQSFLNLVSYYLDFMLNSNVSRRLFVRSIIIYRLFVPKIFVDFTVNSDDNR